MIKYTLSLIIMSISCISHAQDYQARVILQDLKSLSFQNQNNNDAEQSWGPIEAFYSDWSNSGSYYGCSNWTPEASTVLLNTSFTQTATNCTINQTRTITQEQINKITGKHRIIETSTETRILTNQTTTQTAIGTRDNQEGCLGNIKNITTDNMHLENNIPGQDYAYMIKKMQDASFSQINFNSDTWKTSFAVLGDSGEFYHAGYNYYMGKKIGNLVYTNNSAIYRFEGVYEICRKKAN